MRFFLLCAFAAVGATGLYAQDSLRLRTTDDVVVTGTRNETDIRHLPMTISIVGHDKLTDNFRPSVLPTITEQVPGLFATSRGMAGYGVATGSAGSMKIRGIGSGASLLVLIDGQPQYAGLMGHPIPDACQTMMAERVEVLRGPASVLYGSNAMGGVVNIVTRKMDVEGVKTNVLAAGGSYGTVQGEVTNRVRVGKFSSVAGLNYVTTDGHRKNSEFEQYAGFLKLGYDISRRWKAEGDVNITYFEASNPGERQNPYIDNDSKITRGMASLALSNDYGNTSGTVRFFYNWGHHEVNDGYHPGGTPQTSHYLHDDLMAGVSVYQSARLFEGNRTTVGFDYQRFGGEAWNKAVADGKRSDLADKTENEYAGYVDFRQDLASWLTLDAGLRVDHHDVSGTELVPQGGLAFHLPHRNELKAMVSKGFRNPTVRELYMFRPANPELKPERTMNYELGYAWRLPDNRLRIGANLFYVKGENLISTEFTGGKPLNVNINEVENWGAEFELAYKVNPYWSLNANYSALHMEKHVTGAPESKFYAGADYARGKFGLNAGLMIFSGLYTAVGENEKREDAVLLNVALSYRCIKEVKLFVKGENLLARKYETYYGFPMPRATFMGGVSIDF